jgi:cytochrome P450
LVLAAGFETTVNLLGNGIRMLLAGKHLSFSGGRHFCLGAALARAEGEVGLRTFFEHFPDARLAGDGSRRDTRVLRGWSSLPITLGKARTTVGS